MNGVARAGQKIPAERFLAQFIRINAQDFGRIFFGIDGEGNEMDVTLFERPLQLAHARADDRARAGARSEDEIRDPDFAG